MAVMSQAAEPALWQSLASIWRLFYCRCAFLSYLPTTFIFFSFVSLCVSGLGRAGFFLPALFCARASLSRLCGGAVAMAGSLSGRRKPHLRWWTSERVKERALAPGCARAGGRGGEGRGGEGREGKGRGEEKEKKAGGENTSKKCRPEANGQRRLNFVGFVFCFFFWPGTR